MEEGCSFRFVRLLVLCAVLSFAMLGSPRQNQAFPLIDRLPDAVEAVKEAANQAKDMVKGVINWIFHRQGREKEEEEPKDASEVIHQGEEEEQVSLLGIKSQTGTRDEWSQLQSGDQPGSEQAAQAPPKPERAAEETSPSPPPSPEPSRTESTGQGRYFQSGQASTYGDGDGFHGRTAASGEVFDQWKLTAAHLTLPFGTMVRVVRKDTGASVVVRINDRGPYGIPGRIIDLSTQAAIEIGMRMSVAQVDLYIVE